MLRNDKHIIVVRHLKKKKKKRFKEKNRLVQKTSVRLSVALPEVILKAFIVPNFETLHILLEYQSQRHRIPRSNRLHFEKPQKMASLPGKAFSTHRTNVGLVDSSVVRANMVGHPVLPFKALLADRALKRLLV